MIITVNKFQINFNIKTNDEITLNKFKGITLYVD